MLKPGSRNLTTSVVEQLGIAIVTGHYEAGVKFPTEAELCTQFGVSRSVLREAVKMLTAKGLLSARPRQGTRIEPEDNWNVLDPDVLRWLLERQFSYDFLLQFNEVRLAIEPTAAAIAASRATKEDLAPVHAAIDHMKEVDARHEDPLTADIEFHVSVLRASGNRFFIELEGLIEAALRTSIRVTHQLKAASNVADHKRVLDAIESRNPSKAKAAMESIITEAIDLINVARNKKKRKTA